MSSIYSKLSLTLLIVLDYSNTILNTFHFDDIPSILEKPWIRGLEKIPEFILSFFQRPLVILSFNLNYSLLHYQNFNFNLHPNEWNYYPN